MYQIATRKEVEIARYVRTIVVDETLNNYHAGTHGSPERKEVLLSVLYDIAKVPRSIPYSVDTSAQEHRR